MKKLSILVLEDMDEDLELLEYILKDANLKFTIKRVDTRDQFISALNEKPLDIILSDHSMPQFNSQEALAIYRKSGLKIPFILVTGAVSEEFAVNSLKQGADDYVLKSNLTRLPSAIINAIKQREAETAKTEANDIMHKQYEELKKINKELDSFVYSASHNLRAPLSSVLGLINLARIEDEKNGNTFNSYFAMMESSIYKLDETLKEILDYSRNARQNLIIEKIDFKKLLQDNLERMNYMPGSSRIDKRLIIEDPYPLYSDRYRISVILNNIISNAIKYYDAAKADPYLQISVTIGPDKVHMEFEDNGIGIEKSYLNKVFEMFFRGTQRNDGAGLGLYIVQEAVEKLAGTISIQSQLHQGTTFIIDLPNAVNEMSSNV